MIRPSLAIGFLASTSLAVAIVACGGGSASSGAPPDGGVDGHVTKKPTPPNDVPDDQPDAAKPTTWCDRQGTHTFCSDFDKNDLAGEWDGIIDDLDDFKSVPSDRSPPHAVAFTDHASSPEGGFPFAPSFVRELGVKSATKLKMSLDMRIDALGLADDHVGETPVFVSLTRRVGTTTYYSLAAELSLRKTYAELTTYTDADDGGFTIPTTVTTAPLPQGRWVHVDLALTSDGAGNATIDLSYDGQPAAQAHLTGVPSGLGGAHVEIGAINPQFHPGDVVVAFDDVLVDVE